LPPELRVNRVEDADGCDPAKSRGGGGSGRNEAVLPIPHGDALIGPDAGPDHVEDLVFVAGEEIRPEALPLLIDVVCSRLARDGSREQHKVTETTEVVDERLCPCRRKVFCDLQTDDEIETATDVEPLGQIGSEKAVFGDDELLRFHVRPVNTEDILDSEVDGDSNPVAYPAADVHERPRS
jgi:hypothetical protein